LDHHIHSLPISDSGPCKITAGASLPLAKHKEGHNLERVGLEMVGIPKEGRGPWTGWGLERVGIPKKDGSI
jgi:hypothetical protein